MPPLCFAQVVPSCSLLSPDDQRLVPLQQGKCSANSLSHTGLNKLEKDVRAAAWTSPSQGLCLGSFLDAFGLTDYSAAGWTSYESLGCCQVGSQVLVKRSELTCQQVSEETQVLLLCGSLGLGWRSAWVPGWGARQVGQGSLCNEGRAQPWLLEHPFFHTFPQHVIGLLRATLFYAALALAVLRLASFRTLAGQLLRPWNATGRAAQSTRAGEWGCSEPFRG